MSDARPDHSRYQFSLRSLFVLTLFVAVLCSLGICTHWLISAAIGSIVLIGGIPGRIIAGTWLGFLAGVAYAYFLSMTVGAGCIFLALRYSLLWSASWWLWGAVGWVTMLIGGVYGGYRARLHPKR